MLAVKPAHQARSEGRKYFTTRFACGSASISGYGGSPGIAARAQGPRSVNLLQTPRSATLPLVVMKLDPNASRKAQRSAVASPYARTTQKKPQKEVSALVRVLGLT